MKGKFSNAALRLCVTALFAAVMVGGKEALAALPNVEVVTLVTAVCAFCWGAAVCLPAVAAFILAEIAVWGVNTWVISYLLHWNVVAAAFCLLSKFVKKPLSQAVAATVVGTVLTALFSVVTSAVDTLIGYTGKGFFWDGSDFASRFAVMYAAGSAFFLTHVISNAVILAVAFLPLKTLNEKIKLRLC